MLLLAGYQQSQLYWRKQEKPPYPDFSNYARIAQVVRTLKESIYRHLLEGINFYIARAGLTNRFRLPLSEPEADVWLAALLTKKYGRIYFISRYEARMLLEQPLNSNDLSFVDRMLSAPEATNAIFNYGILSYLHSVVATIRFPPFKIPAFCVHSAAKDIIFVNEHDFVRFRPDEIFEVPIALYDLHDFSHRACTLLNEELYSAKYFSQTFIGLPSRLKRLIRDPHFATSDALEHSDSLVFRELSLGILDSLNHTTMTERDIVESISAGLTAYHSAQKALFHPSTARMMTASRPLDMDEVAVLSQNKSYEHIASEFEEQLMTRGGDDACDPLSGLPTTCAAQRIVTAQQPFYHDRRNYLRHRAQRESYIQYCSDWLLPRCDSHEDRRFVRQIIRNLTFEDYESGRRLNLFEQVSRHLVPATV
jgi:hypothetical protein